MRNRQRKTAIPERMEIHEMNPLIIQLDAWDILLTVAQ